jgi:hypothetical protein
MPCRCRWTLLAVRSHATGSGGRPAPRGAGDRARAASSRVRRRRHLRRRHRPHCQPARRRLQSSLPHQEQVNEFGPTGLQPVPHTACRTEGPGAALWVLTSGPDRPCDESSRGRAEVAMAPGRGLCPGHPPGAGPGRDGQLHGDRARGTGRATCPWRLSPGRRLGCGPDFAAALRNAPARRIGPQ